MTIDELRENKKAYVINKADEIVNLMCVQGRTTHRISTCDAGRYGWDVEEHFNFPDVANELRKRGFRVDCRVNHEVTDWTIVA